MEPAKILDLIIMIVFLKEMLEFIFLPEDVLCDVFDKSAHLQLRQYLQTFKMLLAYLLERYGIGRIA